MSLRTLYDLLAVLIVVLTLTVIILLSGCATTELTVTENKTIKWKSTTFLKNVKDADVQWGTFHARLGSSLGDHETASVIMPGSLMQTVADTGKVTMMGGSLVDTLGRPRGATPAEMAAQYELLARLGAQ